MKRYYILLAILLTTACLKAAGAGTPNNLTDQQTIEHFLVQGATFAIKKGGVDAKGKARYIFCSHPTTDFQSIQMVIATLAERSKRKAEDLNSDTLVALADALETKADPLRSAEQPPTIVGETQLSASYGPTFLLKSTSDQAAIDFFVKSGAIFATIKESSCTYKEGKATYIFHRRHTSDYKNQTVGTANLRTHYGLLFELIAESSVTPSSIQ